MSEVEDFEKKIAEFFGAPYAVGLDSCTHGLELCLRYKQAEYITVPRRTYLSVAMLANKLGIELRWDDREWKDYYPVYPDIFDAAVLWKRDSYIPGTMMCVSMQYQKPLSLGRCGVILLDKYLDAVELKKMSYDGRLPNTPWREQDVEDFGYHYYLQPETAIAGLIKLPDAIAREPRQWSIKDYPDISKFKVFNK